MLKYRDVYICMSALSMVSATMVNLVGIGQLKIELGVPRIWTDVADGYETGCIQLNNKIAIK